MYPTRREIIGGVASMLMTLSYSPSEAIITQDNEATPPPPRREFRGVWVATVANIDWPSRPNLSTEQQQTELLALLDKAVELRLNAVVFQVRPQCDALYESRLEPWSEYLTGTMGKAPEPYYDPLAFAIEHAHKRGLELHAWFNPYRARHSQAKSPISSNHVKFLKPSIVRSYGKFLWLDPTDPLTQEHSLSVFLDVVNRYDVDAIHIDDYFYPYKEKDESGKILEFPDEPNWTKYKSSGGNLSRDDWRRDNVNKFIERVYKEIKKAKPHVRFGISPFGIWRPGNPPEIKGFDAYAELYADARLWLRQGWLDYCAPQLYWKVDQPNLNYVPLLKWWLKENRKRRHIWPGNYTSRVGDGSATQWNAQEVVQQIKLTREQDGATGNIHFSMQALFRNATGLAGLLSNEVYADQALVPASTWLPKERHNKPTIEIKKNTESGQTMLAWTAANEEKVWLWVVQSRAVGRDWSTRILPGSTLGEPLELYMVNNLPTQVVVTPVDRCGNLGTPASVATMPENKTP